MQVTLKALTVTTLVTGREILSIPESSRTNREEDFTDVDQISIADYGGVPPSPKIPTPGNTPAGKPPAPGG